MRQRRGIPARIFRGLVDLVLLSAVVYMAVQVLVPAIGVANVRSDARIVSIEASRIYDALDRHYRIHGSFPEAGGNSGLEPDTLEPLRRRGYYRGFVTVKLRDRRIDAYESPDDRGGNQEFWLEMTLASDPRIRFLVARSDDAPSSGGLWRDGAFLLRNGTMERL